MVWTLAVVVGLGVVLALMYNRLVALRQLLQEALSGVDVQLKRRYDLIPVLVEAVKGYRDFEKSVLLETTRLRSQPLDPSSLRQRQGADEALTGALKSIFLLVEQYPQLKADGQFNQLLASLVETEDNLQNARRYYNGCVRNFNIQVKSFPSSLAASAFNFSQADYFEVGSAVERSAPEVKI